MDKKHRRKILENLLVEVLKIEPEYDRFPGREIAARAEAVGDKIRILTPHANLFPDEFKLRVKDWMTIANLAFEGNEPMVLRLMPMVDPMDEFIRESLENMIIELS